MAFSDAAFIQSHLIISSNSIDLLLNDEHDALLNMLQHFWNMESIGILEDPNKQQPMATFLERMQFKQAHYEVGLLWKEDHPDIPDHFTVCLNHLRFLQRQLLKSPKLLQEYDSVIQDQLKKGIVELVPEATLNGLELNADMNPENAVHYLPHHCVIRQDKQTTKLCIIYDGSAKTKTDVAFLNDCLKTGPNLIPKLFDILIRFHWHLIAATADIEKAFLMIGITPSD